MSIGNKTILLNAIEDRLSTVLTAHDMEITMEIIRDELCATEKGPVEGFSGEYLDAYLQAKAIEGRSKETIKEYRYTLNQALKQINVNERKITVYHLRSYLSSERERGIAESTLEGKRSVLQSYFGWLFKEGLIRTDPCSNLGTIKVPKVVRLPFSDTEIEKLKNGCGNVRDKALICFLLSSGCRISEVTALNRNDVDYQRMQVKVYGKGAKERIVYIDNITCMYLRQYELTRTDTSMALFAGRGTDRMCSSGVRFMLREVGKIMGVKDVHPHRFRRTLATNLIARGMHIQEVARILGHEKLDTTMRYVWLDDTEVQSSYRKYS